MRSLILFCFSCVLLSCQKSEKPGRDHPDSVEIYLLKSFDVNTNLAGPSPAILQIANPVLDDKPLVSDADILFYTRATTTFKLNREISDLVKNFRDEGFAVVVNGSPVYYGRFHPGYSSYVYFGMAIIDPLMVRNKEIAVQFPMIVGRTDLEQYDKRNGEELTTALMRSGRLR